MQLVERNPERAVALFHAAIQAGDRVDSALKDMAIVLKHQNRSEDAILAIASLRDLCSEQAQESLDNVLLDLYKSCGRLDEQIALLKQKLSLLHKGLAFNGRRTKTARSQGKKFQVSVEQEATRLLGNLGWAYMQQLNYVAAEAVYRRALSIEIDNNKVCNLVVCLMKQGRLEEARAVLRNVSPVVAEKKGHLDSHMKSYERAQEILEELQASSTDAKRDHQPRTSSQKWSDRRQLEFESWSHWKPWEAPPLSPERAISQPASYGQPQQCRQFSAKRGHSCNSSLLTEQAAQAEMNCGEQATPEEMNGIVTPATAAGEVAAPVAVAGACTVHQGKDRALHTLQEGIDHHLRSLEQGKDYANFAMAGRSSSSSSVINQQELQQQQLRVVPGFLGNNGRRRLRVFEDLTIVGSAAALRA